MKWLLLVASVLLILSGGIIADFYFHPQKAPYDQKGNYFTPNNPTSWTALASAFDGIFLGVWSVCYALPKGKPNQ